MVYIQNYFTCNNIVEKEYVKADEIKEKLSALQHKLNEVQVIENKFYFLTVKIFYRKIV